MLDSTRNKIINYILNSNHSLWEYDERSESKVTIDDKICIKFSDPILNEDYPILHIYVKPKTYVMSTWMYFFSLSSTSSTRHYDVYHKIMDIKNRKKEDFEEMVDILLK